MTNLILLKDLLEYTRDGEWGKSESGDGLVEMVVIRGTDFADVRYCDFSSVPTRFVPANVSARKKLMPGDILLETAGGTKDQPTGRTVFLSDKHFAQTDTPLTCASFSRFLRVKSDLVDPRYLFWYLQYIYNNREMLPYHIQHTGVARFQYTDFASQCRVPIPGRGYQSAVADVLGSLDDKIELNRRMNETLEAMAQAIFRDWFVDFGPTRRKLDGATDPVVIMGGLVQDADRAKALADLFPAALGDDGMPEGWRLRKIGDVAARVAMGPFGSRITKDNFVDQGVPVIRGKNLACGFVDSDFVFLTPEKAKELSSSIARVEDIVLTHRGTLGQVGRIYPGASFSEYVVSQSQLFLSVNRLKTSSLFLYYFLTSEAGQRTWLSNAGGAGVPAIASPTRSLKDIDFVDPGVSAAAEFGGIVGLFEQRVVAGEHQNNTLATTRDLLLPKLMSGELRLSEAAELAEAAQ